MNFIYCGEHTNYVPTAAIFDEWIEKDAGLMAITVVKSGGETFKSYGFQGQEIHSVKGHPLEELFLKHIKEANQR